MGPCAYLDTHRARLLHCEPKVEPAPRMLGESRFGGEATIAWCVRLTTGQMLERANGEETTPECIYTNIYTHIYQHRVHTPSRRRANA